MPSLAQQAETARGLVKEHQASKRARGSAKDQQFAETGLLASSSLDGETGEGRTIL